MADTIPQMIMQVGFGAVVSFSDGMDRGTQGTCKINARSGTNKKDIGGDLQRYISGKEHGYSCVKLIILKVEVFFYPLDTCVGEGISI